MFKYKRKNSKQYKRTTNNYFKKKEKALISRMNRLASSRSRGPKRALPTARPACGGGRSVPGAAASLLRVSETRLPADLWVYGFRVLGFRVSGFRVSGFRPLRLPEKKKGRELGY